MLRPKRISRTRKATSLRSTGAPPRGAGALRPPALASISVLVSSRMTDLLHSHIREETDIERSCEHRLRVARQYPPGFDSIAHAEARDSAGTAHGYQWDDEIAPERDRLGALFSQPRPVQTPRKPVPPWVGMRHRPNAASLGVKNFI